MTETERIANEVYYRHMPHDECHSVNEYRGNPHDQSWSEIVSEDDRRRLMRGIRNGCIIGLIMWALIIWALWRWL
jgi:hypothetical protein